MRLFNELEQIQKERKVLAREISEFEKGEDLGWLRRKFDYLKKTIRQLLQQGLTPGRIASAFSVGYIMGTFPVLGTHTLLAVGFGWILRLNQLAVNLGAWISVPFYILLLLPSLRTGEFLFGAPAMELDHLLTNMKAMFGSWEQFIHVWKEYGVVIGYTCIGWVPVALLTALPVYLVTFALARKFLNRQVQ